MPMDVCHDLLNRTCQYDKKARHDGRRNTYNFEKNSDKHIFLPLKDEGAVAKISSQFLIMSEEFLK